MGQPFSFRCQMQTVITGHRPRLTRRNESWYEQVCWRSNSKQKQKLGVGRWVVFVEDSLKSIHSIYKCWRIGFLEANSWRENKSTDRSIKVYLPALLGYSNKPADGPTDIPAGSQGSHTFKKKNFPKNLHLQTMLQMWWTDQVVRRDRMSFLNIHT